MKFERDFFTTATLVLLNVGLFICELHLIFGLLDILYSPDPSEDKFDFGIPLLMLKSIPAYCFFLTAMAHALKLFTLFILAPRVQEYNLTFAKIYKRSKMVLVTCVVISITVYLVFIVFMISSDLEKRYTYDNYNMYPQVIMSALASFLFMASFIQIYCSKKHINKEL